MFSRLLAHIKIFCTLVQFFSFSLSILTVLSGQSCSKRQRNFQNLLSCQFCRPGIRSTEACVQRMLRAAGNAAAFLVYDGKSVGIECDREGCFLIRFEMDAAETAEDGIRRSKGGKFVTQIELNHLVRVKCAVVSDTNRCAFAIRLETQNLAFGIAQPIAEGIERLAGVIAIGAASHPGP